MNITPEERARLKALAEQEYGCPYDEIDWDAAHREIREQAKALERWALDRMADEPLDPCPCGSTDFTPNPIPAQLSVIVFCARCHQPRIAYRLGEF